MTTYEFKSLGAACRAIERDSIAREKRVRNAVLKAAKVTAIAVAQDIAPKAFGELADSIHVEIASQGEAYVVADAPHAEAVEVGSRPHMPPLDPIIKWVQLRGIQGLNGRGNFAKPRTDTRQRLNSAVAARSIALQVHDALEGNKRAIRGWRTRALLTHLDADPVTYAIAKAIQLSIAKGGTKPFRYMLAGVPVAMDALDTFVNEALED